jgi:hypothetical protein
MVLASCIATAYKADAGAHDDAAHTAAALFQWDDYDAEEATGKPDQLIADYLGRRYASIGGAGRRLDLLKCLDMYHSQALDDQVRKYVSAPDRSFAEDSSEE